MVPDTLGLIANIVFGTSASGADRDGRGCLGTASIGSMIGSILHGTISTESSKHKTAEQAVVQAPADLAVPDSG